MSKFNEVMVSGTGGIVDFASIFTFQKLNDVIKLGNLGGIAVCTRLFDMANARIVDGNGYGTVPAI